MPKIIKNSITYGSSSPMVELTQAEYNALSSAQKNNGTIYLITDSEPDAFNLDSMDDVSISSPAAGQFLVRNSDNNGWTNLSNACSVTRGSSMASTFPVPYIARSGNVCSLIFGILIPAGTYTSQDTLWTVNPQPKIISRGNMTFGASGGAVRVSTVNILTSGEVRFNGTITIESDTYLIGSIIYVTDG